MATLTGNGHEGRIEAIGRGGESVEYYGQAVFRCRYFGFSLPSAQSVKKKRCQQSKQIVLSIFKCFRIVIYDSLL